MGCEEKKKDMDFSQLVVSKKSEGYLYYKKPVFYDNGNSIIIPSGPSVYLYNTATGNFLKELLQGSNDIISCQLHPLQDSLLITVTENGDLTVYNLKTNEIEYSLELKLNQHLLNKQNAPKFNIKNEENGSEFDWETQPLDSLVHRKFYHAEVKCFLNNPMELFVWASWCLKDEYQCHLSAFTFKSGKHIRLIHLQKSGLAKSYLSFVMHTMQKPELLEVFVGLCGKYVHVTKYNSQKRPHSVKHYMGMKKTLTCVAFHPTECCFATGDSSGRITIWNNIFEKHPLKEVLHWHTLPVGDIFFSKFGNFLFSGGGENVLVKWSLSSNSKDFLPRLSSCIYRISAHSDSSILSVSMTDNKVMLLDFNFQSISTIQNFSIWSVHKKKLKNPIFTVDPRTNSLVRNGKTGHIQFLSLTDGGKFVYTFDVTNRNLITSDGDTTIENTEVTHAKFSADGKWLFTFESRWDGFCKECRLKFWLHSEKLSSYKLSTNVEFPHGDFPIHSLEVSSDGVLATTGGDKNFRLWMLSEYKEQPKRVVKFWAVEAVKKFRNFPCYGLDFSKDNSLIAVTFGPVLTIWDTESCTLKCSLSVPYNKDDFKFCKFGNLELSHLVVTSTEHMICSWNIITLSMMWTVPLKVSLLISDPYSLYMALFSADNHLVIFSPSSPTPDLIMQNVSDSPVIAALSAPLVPGNFTLYFLNAKQDLLCLENSKKTPASYSEAPVHSISTPFTAQLAEIQNQNHADRSKTVPLNRNNKHSVSALMDAPAHTLPNPSALCLDVLKGLLTLSENHSRDSSSANEVPNYFVSKTNPAPAHAPDLDSKEPENKLLAIVDNIFV